MKALRLSERELMEFSQFLSFLLEDSVPIGRALECLVESQSKGGATRLAARMADPISEGESFSSLLRATTTGIPESLLTLIGIGERTGRMGESLRRVGEFLERRRRNRELILRGATYPVFILSLLVVGALFIVLYVFPRVEELIGEIGTATTSSAELTGVVSSMGELLGGILIAVVAVSIALLPYLFRNRERCNRFDEILFRFTPKLAVTMETTAFLSALELLTQGGVFLDEALGAIEGVFTNRVLRQRHRRVVEGVVRGGSPADLIRQEGILSNEAGGWLLYSEETGNVTGAMVRLRRFYEEKLERESHRITSLAEPILILIAGSFLLLFTVKVVLPLFTILGGAL